MIAVLEAIPTNVPALPQAFAGPAAAGPSLLGTFASTLAAAQGRSPDAQSALAKVTSGGGPAVEKVTGNSLDVRTLALGNPAPKKLPSTSPVTPATIAARNIIVPGLVPAIASQVPLPSPATDALPNLAPSRKMTPAVAAPSVPNLSTALSGVLSDAGSGTAQPILQPATYFAGSNNTFSNAVQNQTGGGLIPTPAQDGSATVLTASSTPNTPLTPSVTIPVVAGLSAVEEKSTASNASNSLSRAAITATHAPATMTPQPVRASAPQNSVPIPERSPLPNVNLRAELAIPQAFQEGARSQASVAVVASANPDTGATAGTPSSVSSVSSGFPTAVISSNVPVATNFAVQTDLTTQTGKTSDPAAPVSILLANANVDATTLNAIPDFPAPNLPVGSAASTAVPSDPAVHPDVSAPAATNNPLSGNADAQISAPSVLIPQGAMAPAKAVLQSVAPAVAEVATTPSLRGAARNAGTPVSVPSPASTISDSSQHMAVASQTPFSVFFSGPGPGSESAASALSKMILPASGSAIRDSHGGSVGTTSVNPQAAGPQNGITQSPTPPQSAKDSPAKTESGAGTPSLQAPHVDANLNAVSAQLAAAKTASGPGATPPAVAAVTISANGLPALAADSSPKPATVPGNTTGGAAKTGYLPPEAAGPGPVQVAQIMNHVEQSEMRIGMSTSAFGSVEVRAVVHANDVGLVVGSEKGDLRALLANDMPAITNTLQEQNLRLHSVNFMQGFAFSNNASGQGGSQQHSFVPMRAAAHAGLSEEGKDDSKEAFAGAEFARERNSLSILA